MAPRGRRGCASHLAEPPSAACSPARTTGLCGGPGAGSPRREDAAAPRGEPAPPAPDIGRRGGHRAPLPPPQRASRPDLRTRRRRDRRPRRARPARCSTWAGSSARPGRSTPALSPRELAARAPASPVRRSARAAPRRGPLGARSAGRRGRRTSRPGRPPTGTRQPERLVPPASGTCPRVGRARPRPGAGRPRCGSRGERCSGRRARTPVVAPGTAGRRLRPGGRPRARPRPSRARPRIRRCGGQPRRWCRSAGGPWPEGRRAGAARGRRAARWRPGRPARPRGPRSRGARGRLRLR